MKFPCTFPVAKYLKTTKNALARRQWAFFGVFIADFEQSLYVSITYILLIKNEITFLSRVTNSILATFIMLEIRWGIYSNFLMIHENSSFTDIGYPS